MKDLIKDTGESPPVITYLLLTVTVLIQIYFSVLHPSNAMQIFNTFSLIPVNFFMGKNLESLVSYMFIHGNLLHLLVNSIALYGAGTIIERDIGSIRYLAVFIVSGVISGGVHCVLNASSNLPLVGSSGAIFGLIATVLLLMPFKLTYALVVPLPSVVVGLMLILIELSAFWMPTDIGIAHDVHVSGFLIGGIMAFIYDRKRALRGLFIATVVLALIYYVGVYFRVIPVSA
jgi:membrane associated rhomboid family serine protease